MIIYDRDGDELIPEHIMSEIEVGDGRFDFASLSRYGFTLSTADMSGQSWTGSNFNGMTIEGATFADSQLLRASLGRAQFVDCQFTGADLDSAFMVHSHFGGCDFKDANFHEVLVHHSDFMRSNLTDAANLKKAKGWPKLARGNGKEVVALQLGEQQVTFVLDWAFVACQERPVHEFMSMDDAALLEHGGKDWLRWWRKYKSTLLEFVDAHNVRAADL